MVRSPKPQTRYHLRRAFRECNRRLVEAHPKTRAEMDARFPRPLNPLLLPLRKVKQQRVSQAESAGTPFSLDL